MIDAPIFLIGSERSGTTLLRLMLSSHPQIAWCNEFEYSVDHVGDDGSTPAVADYIESLSAHRIFRATGFTIDPNQTYLENVNGFLEQRRQAENKPIIGATCHRYYHRLLKLWPNAKFIFLHRDGRDVARSCIQMGWDGNVYTGVSRWIIAEEAWDNLKNSLPDDRYTETSYEKLISDPPAVLAQLADFIGPGYDERMLDYDQTTTYKKPDPKLISQWKRKLSKSQLQILESRIGDRLAEQGYELSGHPRITIGPMRRIWFKLHDRFGRLMFRIKRYGLWLSIADSLSLRFGPHAWRKSVLLKKGAIDTTHLR